MYDGDLVDLVRTANEWIESNCHLTLISAEYICYFDSFPESGALKLPLSPVTAIEEIFYYDVNGVSVELETFQTDLIDIPAKLYPAINATWPATQAGKINAVSVELTAGYGANETFVPNLAKHLIKLLVAHWFKNREAVGTASKEIEFSAAELIKMLRRNEFEAFA